MMGNSLEGDLGLAAWGGLLSRRGRHFYSVLHTSTKIGIWGMACPIGRVQPAKCTRRPVSRDSSAIWKLSSACWMQGDGGEVRRSNRRHAARVLKQCPNRKAPDPPLFVAEEYHYFSLEYPYFSLTSLWNCFKYAASTKALCPVML